MFKRVVFLIVALWAATAGASPLVADPVVQLRIIETAPPGHEVCGRYFRSWTIPGEVGRPPTILVWVGDKGLYLRPHMTHVEVDNHLQNPTLVFREYPDRSIRAVIRLNTLDQQASQCLPPPN